MEGKESLVGLDHKKSIENPSTVLSSPACNTLILKLPNRHLLGRQTSSCVF